MRTYEAIVEDARPGVTFSDGEQYQAWSTRCCQQCVVDEIYCPLLDAAFGGFLPREWTPRRDKALAVIPGDFRCRGFKRRA